MPAKDRFHDAVKNALIKDGWTITHDPYHLPMAGKNMYVDLGAEQFLAAEKINEKIAIEIKSFTGPSVLDDLENALGQYVLYRTMLTYQDPDRRVYLAMPFDAGKIFEELFGQILIDPLEEVIIKWIP